MAMKDVTLRDGTVIPKGTCVIAAAHPMHQDTSRYISPEQYNPFRFSSLRVLDGENMKHQYVHTSTEYIPFGHGKHAW